MNLKNYKLSFSLLGLFAFLIPMIPNIIWGCLPNEADYLTLHNVSRPVLDTVEQVTQIVMIALLIVVVHKQGSIKTGKTPVATVTIACLVIYFICWGIYYFGTITPFLMIAMAVIPSLYFILFSIYQRNYYAMIASILFGATHTLITFLNCV